ncbi:carbohydrate ABC transporter permease [Novisyntrophococcus fermenticellae]|uniref:carbohydrate ABC transporter permease n=1 Tax=Novisyntrophococcus fermenticellae TaxID=2068655 RepID=UPI001E37A043|nr:sugar ABC transporter permease [Novisyntrophococcus fermenticellae]
MLHLSKKMRFLPYVLIAPAFLLICIFKLYPIVETALESLFVDSSFTLDTYKSLFSDSSFWNSLWITLKINIVMIPLQVCLAFIVALLVNSTVKGIGIFRTVFYLPVTISITVGCLVWNIMLNPDSGVVNSFLNLLGIPSQDFFISKSQALWCIVLVATWKGVGYWMMFILAGLKNVDIAIYESAKIDGAGWFTTIWKITIPLIKKVLLFVFVANTTANILLFVPMQVITNGGPQESTNVLMFEAYQSAFQYGDRGRASAIVMVLLLLIVCICLFQAALLNENDKSEKVRVK